MLRGRIRWLVYAVVPLSTGLKRAWNEQDLSSRVYYMISPLVTGLVVYGLSRLPSPVRQLEAARAELAELAVSLERQALADTLVRWR